MYGAITVIALVIGWIPVGIVFGIVALALAIAWRATDTSTKVEPRTKPDWMLAMEDPDAPDLTRPEYDTKRRTLDDDDNAAFDRPPTPEEPPPADDAVEATEQQRPSDQPRPAPRSPGD